MSAARYVVRVHRSGVWLGVTAIEDAGKIIPGAILLRGGRRAHAWTGAIDCSALSVDGPGPDSRITDTVDTYVMSDAIIELIEMRPPAIDRLDSIAVEKP